jgi:hypothetical protein
MDAEGLFSAGEEERTRAVRGTNSLREKNARTKVRKNSYAHRVHSTGTNYQRNSRNNRRWTCLKIMEDKEKMKAGKEN